MLSDFTIKSELTGRVYSLAKEVGEMVSSQTSLGVVGDDSHFILELQLDEYDIIKIRKDQEVIVKLKYKAYFFIANGSQFFFSLYFHFLPSYPQLAGIIGVHCR